MVEHTPEEQTVVLQEKIIWTPRFIVLFAVTLILGLSMASQFVLIWSNHLFFANRWALHGLVLLVALGWLAMGVVTHSRWIRAGCVFGLIWAGFMTLTIIINARQGSSNAQLQLSLDAATCVALLGTYLGLSSAGSLRSAWDLWLFLLMPLLAMLALALIYLRSPQLGLDAVEQALPLVALLAAMACWWLRPSCWKLQPGPTLLFGAVPAILLIGAYLNKSAHNLFLLQVVSSSTSSSVNGNNFFFAQVVLLLLLLGCMRIIKSELAN